MNIKYVSMFMFRFYRIYNTFINWAFNYDNSLLFEDSRSVKQKPIIYIIKLYREKTNSSMKVEVDSFCFEKASQIALYGLDDWEIDSYYCIKG